MCRTVYILQWECLPLFPFAFSLPSFWSCRIVYWHSIRLGLWFLHERKGFFSYVHIQWCLFLEAIFRMFICKSHLCISLSLIFFLYVNLGAQYNYECFMVLQIMLFLRFFSLLFFISTCTSKFIIWDKFVRNKEKRAEILSNI